MISFAVSYVEIVLVLRHDFCDTSMAESHKLIFSQTMHFKVAAKYYVVGIFPHIMKFFCSNKLRILIHHCNFFLRKSGLQ